MSAGAEVVWCLGRQVLPTQLIPDEKEGKVLRVRFIQKEGVNFFKPTFLFDEGSTISWIPCGRKLTCSFPGIKFFYGPDTYYGEEVRAESQTENFCLKSWCCSGLWPAATQLSGGVRELDTAWATCVHSLPL